MPCFGLVSRRSQSQGALLEPVEVNEDVKGQHRGEGDDGNGLRHSTDQLTCPRPETNQKILDRLLVGGIVEPVLDGLLSQQFLDVDSEACPDVPEPIDDLEVELRQLLPQFDRLFSDRREDQRDGGDDQRCQDEKREDGSGDPWDTKSFECPHRRLEQENEAGGKGDRQPDHAYRIGKDDGHIADDHRPNGYPDDQGSLSEPVGGHDTRSVTIRRTRIASCRRTRISPIHRRALAISNHRTVAARFRGLRPRPEPEPQRRQERSTRIRP